MPPPAEGAVLKTYHTDFVTFEEGYVRSYIALADTKAAWAFTTASALLAYLLSKDEGKQSLISPELSASYSLLVAGVILLVASGFFSFRVVAPRLRSHSGEGIVFFGTIAENKQASEFVDKVAILNQAALTEARLKHCFDVAQVCTAKYRSLKLSLWLGLPGLVSALIHILIR